jgi:dTDP-4-dehydrorhamnose reductase
VRKILITGSSGMLGLSLSHLLLSAELLSGKKDLDLQNLDATRKWLKYRQYDVIIHLAAVTDLKLAEQNKQATYCLHAEVNKIFLKHCKKLIYVSTVPIWLKSSYIRSHYFDSKKSGEEIVLLKQSSAVLRTNIVGAGGLVGWATKELSSNKRIKGFKNSWFNPIHTDQASEQIASIIEEDKVGIVDAFGDVAVSKYDFLRQVAAKKNLRQDLIIKTNLDKTQDLVWNAEGSSLSYNKCMELI